MGSKRYLLDLSPYVYNRRQMELTTFQSCPRCALPCSQVFSSRARRWSSPSTQLPGSDYRHKRLAVSLFLTCYTVPKDPGVRSRHPPFFETHTKKQLLTRLHERSWRLKEKKRWRTNSITEVPRPQKKYFCPMPSPAAEEEARDTNVHEHTSNWATASFFLHGPCLFPLRISFTGCVSSSLLSSPSSSRLSPFFCQSDTRLRPSLFLIVFCVSLHRHFKNYNAEP